MNSVHFCHHIIVDAKEKTSLLYLIGVLRQEPFGPVLSLVAPPVQKAEVNLTHSDGVF